MPFFQKVGEKASVAGQAIKSKATNIKEIVSEIIKESGSAYDDEEQGDYAAYPNVNRTVNLQGSSASNEPVDVIQPSSSPYVAVSQQESIKPVEA